MLNLFKLISLAEIFLDICRFVVPLLNGNLEVKGILSKVVSAEGSVEEFKVGESVNLFLIVIVL